MLKNFLGSFAFALASLRSHPRKSRLRYSAIFSKKTPSLPFFSQKLCRLARGPQAVEVLVSPRSSSFLCRRYRSSANFGLVFFGPKTGYARPKGSGGAGF